MRDKQYKYEIARAKCIYYKARRDSARSYMDYFKSHGVHHDTPEYARVRATFYRNAKLHKKYHDEAWAILNSQEV